MKKEVHPVIVAIGLLLLLVTIQAVYWRNLAPEKGKPPPGGSPKGRPAGSAAGEPPSGLRGFGVATLAGRPTPGYRDGVGALARFDGPAALALGPDDTLYIADSRNHAIRKLSPGGVVSTLAGRPGADPFGGYADGPAAQARFAAPAGIAALPGGGLVVADTGNHRLRLISAAGVVSTLAGSETAKSELGRPLGGYRDGPAAQAQFRFPVGVAADAQGVIYVADAGNKCVRRLANGQVSTLPTTGGKMESPTAVLVGPGVLYAADTGGHRLWTGPVQGPLHPLASAEKMGLDAPSGIAFASPSELGEAAGLNTFVLDAGTHGLYRLDGQQATLVVGQQGRPGSADGSGEAARLAVPAGMVGRGSTLYVADFGNNSIRKVTVGSPREEVR